MLVVCDGAWTTKRSGGRLRLLQQDSSCCWSVVVVGTGCGGRSGGVHFTAQTSARVVRKDDCGGLFAVAFERSARLVFFLGGRAGGGVSQHGRGGSRVLLLCVCRVMCGTKRPP